MILSEETSFNSGLSELKVYLTKLIRDTFAKVHCLDRGRLLSNH